MMRTEIRLGLTLFVLFLAPLASAVLPPSTEQQKIIDGDGAQDLDIGYIQNKLAELKADNSLEKSSRDSMIDLYESALRQLRATQGFENKTAYFRESTSNTGKEIEKLSRRLKHRLGLSKTIEDSIYRGLSADELRKQLFAVRIRYESLKNNQERLDRKFKRQQNRPEQIRIDQQIILDKLHELEDRKQNTPASGKDTYKAQLIAVQATEKALHAELDALEMELRSHPPRLQLLRIQVDLAIAEVAAESLHVEMLERMVLKSRQTEAARDAEDLADALQAASDKHPVIRETITQNFELGKEFRDSSEQIATAKRQLDEIDQEAKRIAKQSENAEKKIALAGLSPSLAAILREQRRAIPDQEKIDGMVNNVGAKIGQVTLRQFEIEEDLKSLMDTNKMVALNLAKQSKSFQNEKQLGQVRLDLAVMLEKQKSLLKKLDESYSNYSQVLGDIDNSKQQLAKIAERYAAFLDENLLWVRSSPPVDGKFFASLIKSIGWLISPTAWLETGKALLTASLRNKLLLIILTIGLFVTLIARPEIRRRLKNIAKMVGAVRTDRFRYTLHAIGYIIFLAGPLPAALYFLGWWLHADTGLPQFTRAAGLGLSASSIPLFILQVFRSVFAKGGIAELHLKWSEQAVSVIRSQVNWLRLVVVPCVFLISMTAAHGDSEYSDSLGRLALIVLLIAISVGLAMVLHPAHGAIGRFLVSHSASPLARSRYAWYTVAVAVPIVIAGFAAAGYLASAIELEQNLVATIRIVFVSVLVYELSLRGLRLSNRKLARKKLRQKRESEKAERSAGETGESIPLVDPDEIDISTINIQSKRLLLIVVVFTALIELWLLWEDVIPALAILNDWVLWHKTVIVDDVSTIKPVALSNLLLAILYILLAVTATRNLPGVMEIFMVNQLSLGAGSRYAMNQLVRYSLIAVTMIMVATELGGQWSQVQWLVAALGVGLGFGLQEIFANFVSGIILLFERPIRIGDTVTVGDVTGTVTRIQIRATTITDWERKDLVVPNKSFITDQIVNWTRTDNIIRILIPIGIAYGSDTKMACRIMSETIRANPMVLSEPEATVFFVGFGDSSLDFEIRLFVKEVANRLPLRHDLLMQLNEALNAAGIEVPFPQRDLHIRTAATAGALDQSPITVQLKDSR